MHKICAITLDLDDTLWEIGPVIQRAEALLWVWLRENYPRIPDKFSADDVTALREVVVEEYWNEKKHDFRFLRKKVLEMLAVETGYDKALVEPAFQVFDRARNEVALFSDVLPGLEMLVKSYTVIAVTNGNANLETIGIRHLFHDVVTATDVGAAKPARKIFDVAIKKSGVSAEQILHVGDHPLTDIHGGRQAGLKTAWINRNGDEWPDDLQRPDAVVASITELQRMLAESAR